MALLSLLLLLTSPSLSTLKNLSLCLALGLSLSLLAVSCLQPLASPVSLLCYLLTVQAALPLLPGLSLGLTTCSAILHLILLLYFCPGFHHPQERLDLGTFHSH